jgi:Tol biopolymer transport system component
MDEPQLYLRDLNSFESRLVTKSSGAEQPFFSPDGRWVAYYAKGKLQKSEVAGGGNPIMLCNTTSFIGGTWCEDHTIIYSTGGSGLLRISEDGGKPESLTAVNEADQGYAHALPQSLPGSHNVLFTIWGGESTGNALLSLDSLSWEPIRPGTFGIFAASSGSKGYLLSGDLDGGIKAAAFDPARPGLKGIETSVLSDVYFVPDLTKSWLAVSGNGTAVYAKGNTNKKSLVWVYRNGKIEPFFTEQADYNSVAIAPDGSSVLIEQSVLKRYLYIYDLKRPGTRKRLTLQGETGSLNKQPIWSHDASHIFFSSPRGGDWDIYSQPVNSFLSPELSLERPNAQYPYSVANDGTLFFTEYHPKTGGDIWKLTPEAKVESVRVTPFNEYGPVVSPNRKWIAYVSDESSQSEVYILDYPEMKETPNPVSSGGGGMPKWSRDGSELFYRTSDAMMAVTIGPDGSITSEPRRLFDAKDYGYYYDISSDGKRFLMIRRDPGSVPNQLNVILNWTEELKEKVPVP